MAVECGLAGHRPDETYAQRIAPNGAVQWVDDGVPVTNSSAAELLPTILTDGAGGAIIAWVDTRNFPTTNMDIYAQRISSAGAPQWGAGGVAVCDFSGQQFFALTTDGAGGAIVTWEDHRNALDSDLYARRVTAAGAVLWGSATRGVAISTAADQQNYPVIA